MKCTQLALSIQWLPRWPEADVQVGRWKGRGHDEDVRRAVRECEVRHLFKVASTRVMAEKCRVKLTSKLETGLRSASLGSLSAQPTYLHDQLIALRCYPRNACDLQLGRPSKGGTKTVRTRSSHGVSVEPGATSSRTLHATGVPCVQVKEEDERVVPQTLPYYPSTV